MKRIFSKTVKPEDLSHELMMLQECKYIINNVFQDHVEEFGTNKEREVYTIIYERDE